MRSSPTKSAASSVATPNTSVSDGPRKERALALSACAISIASPPSQVSGSMASMRYPISSGGPAEPRRGHGRRHRVNTGIIDGRILVTPLSTGCPSTAFMSPHLVLAAESGEGLRFTLIDDHDRAGPGQLHIPPRSSNRSLKKFEMAASKPQEVVRRAGSDLLDAASTAAPDLPPFNTGQGAGAAKVPVKSPVPLSPTTGASIS